MIQTRVIPLLTGVAVVLLVTLTPIHGEGQKAGSSEAIGCFKCHSFNNSDPTCQDPYHPAHDAYQPHCEDGMENRVGTFPAHYCIKMKGVSTITGVEVMVRMCTLKSMQHQCGLFKFNDEEYKGCLITCEKNGCNHGNNLTSRRPVLALSLFLCLIIFAFRVEDY